MPKNIFVLGLDDINLATLEELPDAHRYAFHGLFTVEELQHGDEIPLAGFIEEATRRLEAFEGTVDAVVGYWDFPVSVMVPILSERFGLPSSTLESRLKCEHKYWARLEQSKVIDEYPRYVLLDPFDEAAVAGIDLAYPFWVKPVKSFSSELAMEVEDERGLHEALATIREEIGRVGNPFEYAMAQVHDLPPEVAELGGHACIAEEAVSGSLCTVEGYSRNGEITVYGLFDSVTYPDSPSFLRFEHPSQVPAAQQERMRDISARIIRQVGLDHSTFNIEFFWDDEGRVTVLEVNPRHSQSHAHLVQDVHGVANHKLMLDLALGEEPTLPKGQGPYGCAAKWFLRVFVDDGTVTRVPTEEEVHAVEERMPGTIVKVLVSEGDRLSELHDQDSYSYKLAELFIGAGDHDELVDKYERCVEALPFAYG